MAKPCSSIFNALAGPSRLSPRPKLVTQRGIFQRTLRSTPVVNRAIPAGQSAGRARLSTSGTREIRDDFGRERVATSLPRPTTHPSRHARRFTTGKPPSAPLLPSFTPSHPSSHHTMLAAAPIVVGLTSDPVDPSASSSVLDPLIALLLSSPLPAGLTIIILTFTFRSAITLPATMWQRRRMKRTKEIVQPAMRAINERLAGVVAKECRAKGLDYEGYKKELKSQLATHQSALHKKHGTHPLPTMLLPLFVHIPLLITLSLTIRRTIEAPCSPWAAESWWWLEHLGEVDPTMILPIMGGVVGMMNAEVIGRRNKDMGVVDVLEVPGSVGTPAAAATTKSSHSSLGGRSAVLKTAVEAPITPATIEPVVPVEIPAAAATTESPATSPEDPTPSTEQGADPATVTPARPPTPRTPSLPAHLLRTKKVSQPPSRSLSTTSFAQMTSSPPLQSSSSPRSALPSKRPKLPGPRRATPSESHLQPIQAASEREKELDKSRLTSKLFTYAMRCGAVLFIPIAAQVPAALALYWTGSMVFTLGQNLVLNWLDAREKQKIVTIGTGAVGRAR